MCIRDSSEADDFPEPEPPVIPNTSIFTSYILYLPIDRRFSHCFKKLICLLKMTASKKSSACRKRTWMHCSKNFMIGIGYNFHLFLCIISPKQKYYRILPFIKTFNNSIGKYLPSFISCLLYTSCISIQSVISEHLRITSLP